MPGGHSEEAQVRLAARMGRLGTESAFEVLAKAHALEATGRTVVHLEIGEPDAPTAPHVVAAAEGALARGLTHYVPSPGIPELRSAVAAHLARAGRLQTTPDRVVITPGGKPVMFFSILALCEPGDEVLCPDPGFPMYASIAAFAGATPVPVPLRAENAFRIDPAELASLVTARTKMVILNSPHNPCGSVSTRQDVEAVAQLAQEHDLVVLSDEIYSALSYVGRPPSVLDVPGMAERTILLDGWSKTFAMTGWRLGYGVFPQALVEPVTRLLVNSVSCVPAFSQHAAIAALEGPWDAVDRMREELRQRRDLVVDGLDAIDGISCQRPDGAFYAFPDVRALGASADVADGLLQQAGVACLPGTAFGAAGEGFLRLSYAAPPAQLQQALGAIGAYAAGR
jgi:aspartate/methionine/tyrosine aminotransferase